MKYKKYNGEDKYHFRIYKKSIGHPFIVVAVLERLDQSGKILISGYMVTHSIQRVMDKPKSYKRLRTNPNPSDSRISFVNKYRINDIPANNFSKPYSKWHLSKEDEMLIDTLEKNYNKKTKQKPQ